VQEAIVEAIRLASQTFRLTPFGGYGLKPVAHPQDPILRSRSGVFHLLVSALTRYERGISDICSGGYHGPRRKDRIKLRIDYGE
jgi:hypothetical protein